ncbi:MAG: hypothetical protein OXK80_01045 [Bdellovibrionales bacterium]|nr:hypothetical protein [Bdellovibrionales bacterium]
MNIYSLPKKFLVPLLLAGGVAFVVLQSPPKGVCDVQKENYITNNEIFLFPKKSSSSGKKEKSFYQTALEECRQNNSPGGCYSLFSSVHRLIQSFQNVDSKCHLQVAQIKEVRESLFLLYSLFIEISWAEGPENELSNPLAWLSVNDVATFCKVQNQIYYFYGEKGVTQLEQKAFQDIAPNHSPEEIRKFSILSENCSYYPR